VQRSRVTAEPADRAHHDVYEDATTIAFLARWPTLLGHTLVAPKQHIESWVHDLGESQFLALQEVVHRVAKAAAELPCPAIPS
jgi:diadenosine tetraphosphate (Ap4A) HIT family hydrolase